MRNCSFLTTFAKFVFLATLSNIVGCAGLGLKPIEYVPDVSLMNKGIDIGSPINDPSVEDIHINGNPDQSAWVIVVFDLDQHGNTLNVRADKSHPVNYFKQAAERYVERSIYPTYVVDDEAVILRNVKTLVIFGVEK